jgi:outer membrane lipoprotein carrier protein
MSTEMNGLGVVRATSRNALRGAAVTFSTAFFGLIFVFAVGPNALAAESPPSTLKSTLSRLQRHYQDTGSFRAKFKESVTRAGAMPQLREGTISFRKPGRMRWEFTGEQPETVVSDGTTIYDYDPGLNQVVETPLKQAFKTQAAAAFILGVGNVQRDFSASSPPSTPKDSLIYLLLTPKRGGDKVALGLDPHTYNIVALALTDSLGNTTALSFSDIQTNVPLASSMFAFKVPNGADIVGAQVPQGTKAPN